MSGRIDERLEYRLVISIFRGTAAGRALRLMANGIGVAAESQSDGEVLYEHYMDSASAVLCSVEADVCFGIIALVHLPSGNIVKSDTLMGGKK